MGNSGLFHVRWNVRNEESEHGLRRQAAAHRLVRQARLYDVRKEKHQQVSFWSVGEIFVRYKF